MFFSSSLLSSICQHLYKFYKQYLSVRVVISVSSCFLCYFRLCVTLLFVRICYLDSVYWFRFCLVFVLFVSVSEFIVLFAILFDFLFQKAKPTTKLVQEHRFYPISEIVANYLFRYRGSVLFFEIFPSFL
uniref:(northern house mosquito) hypothetical protein n=1 Tax=Culex pipiens TaxID=7175 RepID=A0A8D8KLY4_CULPI